MIDLVSPKLCSMDEVLSSVRSVVLCHCLVFPMILVMISSIVKVLNQCPYIWFSRPQILAVGFLFSFFTDFTLFIYFPLLCLQYFLCYKLLQNGLHCDLMVPFSDILHNHFPPPHSLIKVQLFLLFHLFWIGQIFTLSGHWWVSGVCSWWQWAQTEVPQMVECLV